MDQNAVETVLRGAFSENGWEGLQATTENLTTEQQHSAMLAKFEGALEIARPFMDDDGKLCLARLNAMTILQPTWAPEAVGAMEGAAAGFAREGQNSIIRFIQGCIATAEAGPPQPLPTAEE